MRGENLNKEIVVEMLRRKWDAMQNHLDERGRRIWAAAEKKISEQYPGYEQELEAFLDASVIGDPESPLRHVSKSARNVSDALKNRGIRACPETVRTTLKRLGCKMQGNRKVNSNRAEHPDRDAQFQHIKNRRKKP